MKHPRLAPARRVVATVPALCDGLNVGTAPFLIGDRQCADSENMWWERGALRCRKGFYTTLSRWSWEYADDTTQYFVDADGWILALTAGDYESGADVSVVCYDPSGNTTDRGFLANGNRGLRGFLVPTGGEWQTQYSALLFVSNGRVVGMKASQNRFEDITEQVYVPLRMVGGTPVATRKSPTLNGTLLEGENLLTSQFRAQFSTDGSGVYYYLPEVAAGSTLLVTVELNGESTTWSLSTGSTSSAVVAGLCLCFDRKSSCFWFTKEGAPIALEAGQTRQNVTAVADGIGKTTVSPFAMRCGVWFGGTAQGTRLFLGGNNGGQIVWSDVDNPLYFPTSNYATVGTPNNRVTAFGKQGSLLAVFKERELYAVEYVSATKFTDEQVQSGEVTDITATAQFSIAALHAEIGCDLPKTVALCGNRLWWACRDGSVYALQSTGAFSQRNIVRLSAAVEPLLRQNGAPDFTGAAVLDNHYYLLWGNTVLVATDEQTPAWYRFSSAQTAAQPIALFVKDGVLHLPATYPLGESPSVAMFTLEGKTDTRLTHQGTHAGNAVKSTESLPIRGMVCTKQYDFGSPEKRKTVTRVFAEAAATGAVELFYVTERGEVADLPHKSRAVEGLFATPSGVRCRRLGVKFSGEELCLGSVTVRLTEQV